MDEREQELENRVLESWDIFSVTGDIYDGQELVHDIEALEKYQEEERESE